MTVGCGSTTKQEQTFFNDLWQGIAKISTKLERLKEGGPSSF